jgi:catechol 2,3-dioxygenase-like lactoylglutathione lyase family enzyme
MIKLDPIIAVKDIEASAKWYEQIFGFKKAHEGKDFAVLVSENDDIILCLHKWGEHQHPSLIDPSIIPGNGLILYFRTDKMEIIRKNIEDIGCIVEEEIHLNPNSLKKEFSLRDPNGYFLTITEYHTYKT